MNLPQTISRLLVCIFMLNLPLSSTAQEATFDTIENIAVIDMYDRQDGYYAYYPVKTSEQMQFVVFLHGYGALNPMIFGAWIDHLVRQGHCVIYPRYQESMFKPAPTDFVPNTAHAIRHFINLSGAMGIPVDTGSVAYIGHSYGGVIAANLAANYAEYGCPPPLAALICEPGTGPFTGGVLDAYDMISEDVLLAIVVGDHDATVGQEFGLKIFETAVNTPQRVLFWQYSDRHLEESVSSSHYEPYALDTRFDNGIANFTSNKALKVASLDQVDVEGYWQIFDTLLARSQDVSRPLTPDDYEEMSKLGNWSDGTPMRSLDVYLPEVDN